MNDVEKIFILENEMLLSIDNYISIETKNIIIDKISKQKKILLGITNNELRNQKKIDNQMKSVINDNYFDKKPLNINNI